MTFLRPLGAFVIGPDEQWRDRIAADLLSGGWQVCTAAEDGPEPDAGGLPPAVILIPAGATIGRLHRHWLETERRTGVAIIKVGDPQDFRDDREYDGRIATDDIADALAKHGALPFHALPEATHRLAATFGGAAIRPMLDRFALLLGEALSALLSPEGPAVAHRVAGVAGTLGFAELGQQWLALSEGTDTDLDRLRIGSRMAVGAIRRAVIDATD